MCDHLRRSSAHCWAAYAQVHLLPGASATVTVTSGDGAPLGYCAFCVVAEDGKSRRIDAGKYVVSVGDGASSVLTRLVTASGPAQVIPL